MFTMKRRELQIQTTNAKRLRTKTIKKQNLWLDKMSRTSTLPIPAANNVFHDGLIWHSFETERRQCHWDEQRRPPIPILEWREIQCFTTRDSRLTLMKKNLMFLTYGLTSMATPPLNGSTEIKQEMTRDNTYIWKECNSQQNAAP